jgi:hypothetical protein
VVGDGLGEGEERYMGVGKIVGGVGGDGKGVGREWEV